jgi:hypothetical protein
MLDIQSTYQLYFYLLKIFLSGMEKYTNIFTARECTVCKLDVCLFHSQEAAPESIQQIETIAEGKLSGKGSRIIII